MEFRESISLATGSLRTNKLRSLLTLLGIIIGIMAVIIIMTLGQGLQNKLLSSIEGIGASQHIVFISERPEENPDGEEKPEEQFDEPVSDVKDMVTLDQLDKIKADFAPRVRGVDIEVQIPAQARYNNEEFPVNARATRAETFDMNNVEVEYGREITQEDIDGQRPVAVVPQDLVDALFNGDAAAAVGQRVDLVAGSTGVFTIVGVAKAEEKGAGGLDQMFDTSTVFIPLSAVERIDQKIEYVSNFTVMTTGDENPAEFRDELQRYLDRWYANNENAQIEVLDMQSELEGITTFFTAVSGVLASIGGISLLVGGIGVMNVMLITVTERTREIGVRKALGATRRDIRTQFIVESVIVCLLGGIIGVILGGVIGTVASGFLGLIGGGTYGPVAYPPVSAVVVSLLFSMATGVFFGAYPANKAARMQPIDALRYE